MSLKEKVLADLKDAMKNKEEKKLSAIRFLQSAIKNREIELRPNAITDQDILGVVKKLAKQRQESIEQFEKGGRTDLAEAEKFELTVLEGYMPAQLSKEKVEEIVLQVLKDLNANSIKQMGAVMKEVTARTAGAADNKLVSDLVKARLQ